MAPTGSLLYAYAKRGERLLREAADIGDSESLRFWQARKAGWAADTLGVLRGDVDGQSVSDFQRAVRSVPSEGSVHEDLPVELEGLREGLGVLGDLSQQLSRRV